MKNGLILISLISLSSAFCFAAADVCGKSHVIRRDYSLSCRSADGMYALKAKRNSGKSEAVVKIRQKVSSLKFVDGKRLNCQELQISNSAGEKDISFSIHLNRKRYADRFFETALRVDLDSDASVGRANSPPKDTSSMSFPALANKFTKFRFSAGFK